MSLDPLRDARNRDVMRTYNLDALVCRLPENVLLLTGYWPLSSFAFALVPGEGPSALIAVNTEEAAIPAGAVDEVRTFGWGVVSAVDPYGDVQRHLSALIRSAGLERGRTRATSPPRPWRPCRRGVQPRGPKPFARLA